MFEEPLVPCNKAGIGIILRFEEGGNDMDVL